MTYGAPAAWVQNASGNWVLPYAQNISAALESATLRPDLSQELSGVYRSPNPEAYPISAYSYIVSQCAGGRSPHLQGPVLQPRCGGDARPLDALHRLRGAGEHARIGYSPLPSNLSQEIANSIARMQGVAPEGLNAGNCANPRFRGSLGAGSGSPPDPLANVTDLSGAGGGTSPGATSAAPAESEQAAAGAGRNGATKSAGGGSDVWRDASPAAYKRPGVPGAATLPLLVFLAVVALPPLVAGAVRIVRTRRRAERSA